MKGVKYQYAHGQLNQFLKGKLSSTDILGLQEGDIIRLYTWNWKSPRAGECPSQIYKVEWIASTRGDVTVDG